MKTDKTKQPSTTADNGRDAGGRFTKGNKYAKGNPHAKTVARLRSALLSAIKPSDITAIVRILILRAKKGDIASIKEVLDRAIGKPIETDLLEELKSLENFVNEFERKNQCT